MTRLHLGFDASCLADGSADRGVGTYSRRLLQGLVEHDDITVRALAPRGTTLPRGAELVPAWRVSHHRVGPVLQGLVLPIEVRRLGVQVFHQPGLLPARTGPVAHVVTLHDLTPLVFPHQLMARDARRWRRRAHVLRHADAVIAVSASSAAQGIELLGLDADRVHVIHHGTDERFRPGPRTVSGEPYVLAVSSWGPHKGFRELAHVWDRLVDAGVPHRLRILGRQDPWMQHHLEEDLAASRHRDRIDVLGWVPDLAVEYRSADALLVTSRAEGFGLPAAEALACGTPVVAFDNTSLPEVVGDGGLLVPDGEVGLFAEAVIDLLSRPDKRASLSALALTQAGRFSWAESISRHVSLYRALSGG